MSTPEREPCPDRILDDCGGAFAMGAVAGSVFHFMKGMYNSPNGHRFSGGAQVARMKAPHTGGSFAAWGGLFSTFDCAMVYVRQKEDPWNSIIAGAATGGFLSMRQGLLVSGKSALVGAGLLALIEGAGIMVNRVFATLPPLPLEDPNHTGAGPIVFPGQPPPPPQPIVIENSPGPESGLSGWFGGLFRTKEEKATAGDRKTEMLESFDTPSAPIPSFEYK